MSNSLYDTDFVAWTAEQARLLRDGRRAPPRRTNPGEEPSLKPLLAEIRADAYGDTLIAAERQTGLPESAFPRCLPMDLRRSDAGGGSGRHFRHVKKAPEGLCVLPLPPL